MDTVSIDKLFKSNKSTEFLEPPNITIFSLTRAEDRDNIESLIRTKSIIDIIDQYDLLLEELFFVKNPSFKFRGKSANEFNEYQVFLHDLFGNSNLTETGHWVYYPWSKKLVHFLPEDLHYEIRTARNKNLITKEEQEKYRNFKVGVAGLSVGQSIALTLITTGGSDSIHLADFDSIEGTNINRIRAGFDVLGLNKAYYAARIIYEINPFAKIKIFSEGISTANIDQFFDGLTVVVDEVDHFPTKVLIREEAKKRRIPVVMAGDIGDSVIVDIERYDINRDQKLFNGKLSNEEIEDIKKSLIDFPKMAEIFYKVSGGKDVLSKRLVSSTTLVGSEISGPPQLGSTTFMAGSVLSFIIRKLACEEKINSCSLMIDLEMHLLKSKNSINELFSEKY